MATMEQLEAKWEAMHDYWWSRAAKIREYKIATGRSELTEDELDSILGKRETSEQNGKELQEANVRRLAQQRRESGRNWREMAAIRRGYQPKANHHHYGGGRNVFQVSIGGRSFHVGTYRDPSKRREVAEKAKARAAELWRIYTQELLGEA